MNLLKAAELRVGILVVIVVTLIAYMSMQISEDPSYMGRSNEYWFLVPDAGGLVKNSSVKMAGISIGIIKSISLQEGQARIEMSLKPDIKLYTTAEVTIKAQGILGDKHVEIYPGSPNSPQIDRGSRILIVKDKGSLDNVISQVGDIAESLKDVSKNIKEAISDDGTERHILGRIVKNVEDATADLADITADNKEGLGEVVERVRRISTTLDELINDPSEKGFKKSWGRTIASLDNTMKNLDDISSKVNKGQGTLGKLVNDDQTVEELNSAIEGISSYLDAANKLQTGIDFHSNYLSNLEAASTTVGIRIQPGLDRYYLLGVVDDPVGVVERIDTRTTGSTVTDISERKTFHNKTKFTALFAKNFFNFTIKGGLIENTGGLGIDYRLFRDKLLLSMEAFDFSNLNLRTQIQYNFFKGLYVTGGVNDILSRSQKYSNYLGVGLLLTNDDLKMLLSKMPL